jgi:hypothetical protein
MKKIFLIFIMAVAVAACQKEPPVTATIDQNGDCVIQNSLVCFRINGSNNPVVTNGMEAILKAGSSKKDIVVKDRKAAVAASLNDGGSALMLNDSLYYPHENFESFELVEQTDRHVIFKLTYPKFLVGEDSVTLYRNITLRENSYYCEVKDSYDVGHVGQNITVVAGFAKRNVEKSEVGNDYIIAWESVPDEGNMGVGILMPMTKKFEFDGPEDNAVAIYDTKSGRPCSYAVGYCWSQGALPDYDSWAKLIR